jgi:chemotaxis signal transduction protein
MLNTPQKPIRFATYIAGVPVLIGGDWASEYFENLEVFPLPSASSRLIGIAQVRGEVVPVFDPTLNRSQIAHARRKLALMIVKSSEGFVGVAVESEPLRVQLTAPVRVGQCECAFTSALSQPHTGRVLSTEADVSEATKVWWQLDIEKFFNELSKNSSQALAA